MWYLKREENKSCYYVDVRTCIKKEILLTESIYFKEIHFERVLIMFSSIFKLNKSI